MKTSILIPLYAALLATATARDVGIEWDPNPETDEVIFYRIEILNDAGEWVPLRDDIPHEVVPSAVSVGNDNEPLPAIYVALTDFPETAAEIRVFARNEHLESLPSDPFVVVVGPGKVTGLRQFRVPSE